MRGWSGRTALITGASSGIGEAFARALASRGADLFLTARSIDRLEAIAEELRRSDGVSVRVIGADLVDPEAPLAIHRAVAASGQQVDLLINNAGFGIVGDFADQSPERQMALLQVNVTALTCLTRLFLPAMLERRCGAVIQVASTASFQGVPYLALYAATKAFIMNLSEGLAAECAPFGVKVLGFCPGSTATAFHETAIAGSMMADGVSAGEPHRRMQTAAEVVDYALDCLDRGRILAIPGLANRLMIFSERLVPRSFITRKAAGLYRRFSTRR